MTGNQEAKKQFSAKKSSESPEPLNAAPVNQSILKDLLWGSPWYEESLAPAHGKKVLPHQGHVHFSP